MNTPAALRGPQTPVRYCGRDFSRDELEEIRRIIAAPDHPHRAAIARRVCERLQWLKPDGGLKTMSCSVVLRRMQQDGLILLPPPTRPAPQRRQIVFTPATDPGPVLEGTRGDLGPLELRPVRSRDDSSRWNELTARYHYAGYRPLAGAQMRYLVFADGRLLAALGFGASAWRIADREEFIGWTPAQREARLHLVVGLARFLICPWIRVKFLASSLLGQVARTLPQQWAERYAYEPQMLETFVECDRFEATSFRAAGWTYVGETMGRGKCDRQHGRPVTSFKSIWVRPLNSRFREVLCAPLDGGRA